MVAHTTKQDIPWIHLVRVIACIMVVCLHVSTAARIIASDTTDLSFCRLVGLLSKPCVPLFFMITGFLILPYRNGDDIIGFYRKRIPRVLFPLLFWGVVYAILPFCLGMEDINTMLKELILSPIKMPDKIGGILWYLFILIGIYLFIPFMSTRIYESKQMIKVYLLIWLLSSLVLNLKQYVPNVFGENHWVHNFDMFIYFSGYMGFLLCGYFIRKHGAIPIPKILTGGGKVKWVILLIVSIIVCHYIGILSMSFLNIGTIVMTFCTFMIMYEYALRERSWTYKIIRRVSEMSFGIYLCHMLVLKTLTDQVYNIFGTGWYYQIACMIFTFTISYMLSLCISKLSFKKYLIG